jgi:hypothetical protein
MGTSSGGSHLAPVTNMTACLDGYMDGWKHWCKTDTKDCADYISNGIFPGSRINTTNSIAGSLQP